MLRIRSAFQTRILLSAMVPVSLLIMWATVLWYAMEGVKLRTWVQWCFFAMLSVRYVRLIIHIVAHWRYKSITIPKRPTIFCKDVTIILPTISSNIEELRGALQSMLSCHPFKILLVTTTNKYQKLLELAESMHTENIIVLHIPVANKRYQVCEAIPLVKTPITVIADDDVEWPPTIFPWLLAPLENKEIGGVGTCQRIRRLKTGTLTELWYNWLGAAYIERRNFEISATHYIDGGTSCMSGRTCALRTEVLQGPDFLLRFTTEKWGRYRLNADDDNFITRYLVAKGWKTWIQYNRECEIETTLENNSKFLHQCLRWARSNWRSNWKSMFVERYIWRKQPWCSYALHLTMFINFAVVVDPLLFWLCHQSTSSCTNRIKISLRIAFYIWWLTTKSVKLIGLYRHNIGDICFLPVSILFGYFHSFIKLYAALTLDQIGWGSR